MNILTGTVVARRLDTDRQIVLLMVSTAGNGSGHSEVITHAPLTCDAVESDGVVARGRWIADIGYDYAHFAAESLMVVKDPQCG